MIKAWRKKVPLKRVVLSTPTRVDVGTSTYDGPDFTAPAFATSAVRAGWLTVNEARAREGLPPLGELAGNERLAALSGDAFREAFQLSDIPAAEQVGSRFESIDFDEPPEITPVAPPKRDIEP